MTPNARVSPRPTAKRRWRRRRPALTTLRTTASLSTKCEYAEVKIGNLQRRLAIITYPAGTYG